ncbi:MAG: hypothetical protein JWM21_4338 [Acidobacteria bacterium]|nr:hypothetical protein [Acidobacteriota bacterium]
MRQFWLGVTLVCICVAVLALWRQHYDAAFIIGTVAALAWFLNYRARIKETIGEPDEESSTEE